MPRPDDTLRAASLADLPSSIRAVGIVGTPSIAALYLMYILAGDVKDASEASREQALANGVQLQALRADFTTAVSQRTIENNAILSILRQMCVNQAPDKVAAERCIAGR